MRSCRSTDFWRPNPLRRQLPGKVQREGLPRRRGRAPLLLTRRRRRAAPPARACPEGRGSWRREARPWGLGLTPPGVGAGPDGVARGRRSQSHRRGDRSGSEPTSRWATRPRRSARRATPVPCAGHGTDPNPPSWEARHRPRSSVGSRRGSRRRSTRLGTCRSVSARVHSPLRATGSQPPKCSRTRANLGQVLARSKRSAARAVYCSD